MALKPDRNVIADDISFFMDQTAERGGIVSLNTAGSGSAMDQAQADVNYPNDASGTMPVGMLMQDVVNLDLTRQHENFWQDEVQKGEKVHIMTNGWAVTDRIIGSATPSAADRAFVTASGLLTSADNGTEDTPIVGRFLSTKDEEGFAKVSINLPQARS